MLRSQYGLFCYLFIAIEAASFKAKCKIRFNLLRLDKEINWIFYYFCFMINNFTGKTVVVEFSLLFNLWPRTWGKEDHPTSPSIHQQRHQRKAKSLWYECKSQLQDEESGLLQISQVFNLRLLGTITSRTNRFHRNCKNCVKDVKPLKNYGN